MLFLSRVEGEVEAETETEAEAEVEAEVEAYLTILSYHPILPSYLTILSYLLTKEFSFPSDINSTN